ncbi:alpha/beta hydrolase [Hyphomonas johnsonii]|uniref:Alpha/beta hydrolase fold family protein n=1 Tax=Hyphomonas johnsonii MHS-2 TaxID=1280950 RepID=A0A059FJN7_9PROT|nr:alpha/beta hydrolase [Hyphomonas johnsonii]KCZ90688.1 alpha/beta hydrolase fold family protein [Hyphomonas johnsonii MHS-2]
MSLQQTIAKLMFKLPGGWLVRLAGGKPIEINGRVLEPQLQLVAWNGRKAPPLSSLPADVVQAATKEQLAMLAADPEPGVAFEDFTIPGPDKNEIPVRLYRPDEQEPAHPMMVYYHMGGGVIGDIETCHAFCSMIAKTAQCPVLSVDYRLAPQHKFPAGIDDAIAAYEWALRNAGKYGAPEGVAAVGGDSMGGNFAAIVAQEMKREDKPVPALQLLIYPAIDLVEEFPSRTVFSDTFSLSADTMNWFMDQYLPEGFDRSDALLSPGQTGDLSGLPPAIVITAGHDPLVDEGDDYALRLGRDGVYVKHKRFDALAHAFTAFTDFSPGSRAACEEIAGMVHDMYGRL